MLHYRPTSPYVKQHKGHRDMNILLVHFRFTGLQYQELEKENRALKIQVGRLQRQNSRIESQLAKIQRHAVIKNGEVKT